MPKYENGVIYKLKHNLDYDDENIYIGSTCNFKHRKNCHKTACNNEKCIGYNVSVYQFIRDNGGWDEWIMIAIEEYPCDSRKKLETRERYHIDLLRPTLNKDIPTRTIKEWREANKEYFKEWREDNKEYFKKWRENNKEYFKEYYEDNKEYFKEFYKKNKEKINKNHKEYQENNKEKIKEQRGGYYEANKEKIKEYFKEKVICEKCGSEIRRAGLKNHQRTKKCINFKKD